MKKDVECVSENCQSILKSVVEDKDTVSYWPGWEEPVALIITHYY